MKILRFIPIFGTFLILFLLSCEKTPDVPSINNTDREEAATYQLKSAEAIDTSQYPIHIRDSYNDYFYMTPATNMSSVPADYYAYIGYFVHNDVEYDASIIYYGKTKTFAATLFYLNDQCMIYHTNWMSSNYFKGTYIWVKTPSASLKKQRAISCTFLKGSFPGMNNGAKSAKVLVPEVENPGPREFEY